MKSVIRLFSSSLKNGIKGSSMIGRSGFVKGGVGLIGVAGLVGAYYAFQPKSNLEVARDSQISYPTTQEATFQSFCLDDESNSGKEIETVKVQTGLLREILHHLQPEWLLVVSIIAVTSGSAYVSIMIPSAIGSVVTIIQSSTLISGPLAISLLNPAAFKLLGLFVVNGILTFVSISLVTALGENLSHSIKLELFTSLINADLAFFDSKMTGEIAARLNTDVQEFKHTFKLLLVQGLKSTAQILGSTISLLSLSPSLTLTLFLALPPMYTGMSIYGSFLRRLSKECKDNDGLSGSIATESIGNIKTVKAFVAEDFEIDRFQAVSSASSDLATRLGVNIGIFQALISTSIGGMVCGILYFGGMAVERGDMTGGDLMAFLVVTQNTQRSLTSLAVLFSQALKAISSAARVFEYSHLPNRTGYTPAERFRGSIRFENVCFAYPSRSELIVLDDFSLEIEPGTVVALVGPSGVGKSTIVQLLEGFYVPDSGTIYVDGHDLSKIDPKWVRRGTGFISQEPVLFGRSIKENIIYSNPQATEDTVIKAAALANAHTFITAFPNSYDTVLGEGGNTVSGGEKQRIALARAIVGDPGVLILDEATSALDIESEKVVQAALDKVMKGKTTIVIAHRLSTIQNADRILVLGKSGILEDGNHESLMEDKMGGYATMINGLNGRKYTD